MKNPFQKERISCYFYHETGYIRNRIFYMNKFLLIIIILLSFKAFSQATKIKIKKVKEKEEKEKAVSYNQFSFDVYYGNRVYNNNNYYNQLNTIDHIDLNLPTRLIGIGFSGYSHGFKSDKWVYLANYYKIIPARVLIDDSLSTKLSGYVAGYGLGLALSSLKRKINLNIYLGFNTGRTILIKNDYISQKNQFFSPKISIQPKVIIKRLAISLMLEAEYDVSNPKWKQPVFERKGPYLLKPFQQSCLTGLVCLGYKFY